ncbi:MAG: serine hydrolase domain-containing protein [Pseudomonadota bacterium]
MPTKRPMTSLFAALALVTAGCTTFNGPTMTAPSTDANRQAVLTNLAPPILLTGEKRPSWTLEERMQHHKVPGISIAVLERGTITWDAVAGVADAEQQVPVEATTKFQAASISKPITALVALMMAEEGRIDLDAPVSDYLKRWQVPAHAWSASEPVTIRQILAHSSGLTVHGFPGYKEGERLPSAVEILQGSGPANTSAVIVDKRPGQDFRYSGGGYTVLQVLLEDVAGEPFPDLMQRRVLGPARMTNSSFAQPLPDLSVPNASAAHTSDGTPIGGHSHRYPELAAAGLWTTAEDLIKLSVYFAGAERGTEPMLSARTLSQMRTLFPGGAYGLGFEVYPVGDGYALEHTGGNAGFKAYWMFDDAGAYGIAVMTNSDSGAALYREIRSAAAEVYGWPYGASDVRDTARLTDAERDAIAGRYLGQAGDAQYVLTVTNDDGRLVVESDAGIPPDVVYMEVDRSGLFSQGGGRLTAIYEGEALTALRVFGIDFIKQ